MSIPFSRLRGAILCLAFLCALPAVPSLGESSEPAVPRPQGYVSDYVGVVDAATRRDLDVLISELKAKTGAEIAVVVVDSTAPLTPFDYAMKIAEAWKPGARGKDNGVVFLVAVKDREMFILTGYGVEGVLPDGKVGEIRDRVVVPAFRRGDYSGGIRDATQTIAQIIAAGAGVRLDTVRSSPPRGQPEPTVLSSLLWLLLIIIFLALMTRFPMGPFIFGAPGMRSGGGFGGGFGGGGGGFGGFGGGDFGGGGAGGKW